MDNKYLILSALSEGLTIVGFYLASIAYGLFYQVRDGPMHRTKSHNPVSERYLDRSSLHCNVGGHRARG